MKLLFAIINNDDSAAVTSALTREKFKVTKLSTTGGFLLTGNTTLLIGSDDDQVEKVERSYMIFPRRVKRRFPPAAALARACITTA